MGGNYSVETFSVNSLEIKNSSEKLMESVLISFGAYMKADLQTSAFAFIYDYMFCTTSAVYEFSELNQGIQESDYKNFDVYLYGTNLDKAGILSEQIVHLELVQDQITSKFGFKIIASFGLHPISEKAVPQGFFRLQANQFFVATKSAIRVYDRIEQKVKGAQQKNQNTLDCSIVENMAFVQSIGTDNMVLVEAWDTTKDFSAPKFAFKHSIQTPVVTASYLKVETDDKTFSKGKIEIYSVLESEKTNIYYILMTFDQQIIDLFNSKKQNFVINQKLKCLRIHTDKDSKPEPDPMFIFLDTSNQLQIFSLKLQDGSIHSQTHSDPISFYPYIGSTKYRVQNSLKWDFWAFGVTQELMLQGTSYTFPKQVGFIFSTFKNRITQLMFPDSNILLDSGYFFDLIEVKVSSYGSTETYFNSALEIVKIKVGESKNEWIENMSSCKKFDIMPVNSTCFYYSVFDTYSKFLDTNTSFKNVPKKNFCDQQVIFDFSDYKFLSSSDKNMRSTCYPSFQDQQAPLVIPNFKNMPILNVDYSAFSVKWNSTLQNDTSIFKKSFRLGINEISDYNSIADQKIYYGYNSSAVFSPKKVKNKVFKLKAEKSMQIVLVPQGQEANFKMKYECWSIRCPYFIHFETKNLKIFTQSTETFQFNTNGTFVYFVEIQQLNKYNVTRITYTFELSAAKIKKPKGIDINAPFLDWYAANKNIIPWYAPPNKPTAASGINDKSAISKSGIRISKKLKSIENTFDQKTIAVLATWSDEEVTQAFQEARERMKRIVIPNEVKITMDVNGKLKINFSNSVTFPTYLTKQFLRSETNSSQSDSTSRKERRDRRLGLFINSNFLINPNVIFEEQQPQVECLQYKDADWCKSCYYSYDQPWCQICEDQFEDFDYDDCNSEKTNQESDLIIADAVQDSEESDQDEDLSQKDAIALLQNPIKNNESDSTFDLLSAQFYDDSSCESYDSSCIQSIDCDPADPECVTDTDCDPNDPECVKAADCDPANPECVQLVDCDPADPNCQQLADETITLNYVPSKPTCSDSQYYDEIQQKCLSLQIYFGTFDDIFKVEIQSSQSSLLRRLSSSPKKSIKVSDKLIEVQFYFEDPLEITPNDSITIYMNFTPFDKSLKSEPIKKACPRQIIPGFATKSVNALANASQAASAATVAGSAAIQIILSGSLAQLWGMINGMQFVLNLPAMNVNIPAPVFLIVSKIIMVANFDFPYVTLDSFQFYRLPNAEKILINASENFRIQIDLLGYNSAQISSSLGSGFIMILITIFGLIFILVTLPFIGIQRINCCKRLNFWLRKQFLWNWVIRLTLEQALELGFLLVFQFKYGKLEMIEFGSIVNFIIAGILAMMLALLPFFISIFYMKNFAKLADEEFREKYGTPYEGLMTNKRSSIAYSVIFIVRRLLFSAICITLYNNIMIELPLLVLLTMFNACFLMIYSPFEDKLIERLDILNDIVTFLLIDLCYLFTDLWDDIQGQYNIGFVFIAIMSGGILPQIFFLAQDIFWQLKWRLRALCLKKKFMKGPAMRSASGRKRSIFRKIMEIFLKQKKEVIMEKPVEMSIQSANQQGQENFIRFENPNNAMKQNSSSSEESISQSEESIEVVTVLLQDLSIQQLAPTNEKIIEYIQPSPISHGEYYLEKTIAQRQKKIFEEENQNSASKLLLVEQELNQLENVSFTMVGSGDDLEYGNQNDVQIPNAAEKKSAALIALKVNQSVINVVKNLFQTAKTTVADQTQIPDSRQYDV